MNLIGAKVIVLILLGLVKLGSGLAPLLFVRLLRKGGLKWIEHFMAGLMCFGGGVLLATVFIHMLPEVRTSLEQSWIDGGADRSQADVYPFGELVLCGGFFVIYLIEASVHRIFKIHSHSHGLPTGAGEENGVSSVYKTEDGYNNPSFTSDNNKTASVNGNTLPMESVAASNGKDGHHEEPKVSERSILAAIRSFVIVMALSIHAIFEGMAIGLQLNEGDVWKLFIAVAIHECAILFCVGNEMVNNGIRRCQMVSYMVALALVTPIGMVIGIILTLHVDSSSASQTLVIGILQGIAGGTLLYITFFEVLEREKLEKIGMTGLLGCFLIILGFGLMAGLEAIGGHDHGMASNGTTTAISTS